MPVILRKLWLNKEEESGDHHFSSLRSEMLQETRGRDPSLPACQEGDGPGMRCQSSPLVQSCNQPGAFASGEAALDNQAW